MVFPAIMQVDYVRVYQRKGQTNIGCDPADYPTKTYIDNHPDAYSSMYSRRACYLFKSNSNPSTAFRP